MKDRDRTLSPLEIVNQYYYELRVNRSPDQGKLTSYAQAIVDVWKEDTPIATPDFLQNTALLIKRIVIEEFEPDETFANNMRFLKERTLDALPLDVGLTPVRNQRLALDSQITYFTERFDLILDKVTPLEEAA